VPACVTRCPTGLVLPLLRCSIGNGASSDLLTLARVALEGAISEIDLLELLPGAPQQEREPARNGAEHVAA
jgi:hypothetical protein